VGAQAGDRVVDVVDGEHHAVQAQRVRRRVLRLGAGRRGGVVLGQLQLAVAVRGPHHRDVAPDAVESDGAVRKQAFDLRLAFELHAELGEERDGGVQVVDDDGDVVQPLNGHVAEHKAAASRRFVCRNRVARRWWGRGLKARFAGALAMVNGSSG
jgi:hypothetical protein